MTSLQTQRTHVIAVARSRLEQKPVYIDTETTGLSRGDEIVEISIIDHDGTILLSSLVKPSQPIPREAERIHGITNQMVASAQPWPILWPQVRAILFGRTIAAYNAEFDIRLIVQSHQKYRLPWRDKLDYFDVLRLFSDYRAEWDTRRGSNRFFSLADAGRFFQIPIPNTHRSTDDALLTRAVLHAIAEVPL